jgi:hypothetical protein
MRTWSGIANGLGGTPVRSWRDLVPTITEARVMRSIKITSRIKHLPVLSHVAFL